MPKRNEEKDNVDKIFNDMIALIDAFRDKWRPGGWHDQISSTPKYCVYCQQPHLEKVRLIGQTVRYRCSRCDAKFEFTES